MMNIIQILNVLKRLMKSYGKNLIKIIKKISKKELKKFMEMKN